MFNVLLAVVPVGGILVMSEILWRLKVVKGEVARKFIHILAGVWMAFWPLYLPFDGIFMLGCMALALLIYSRVTRLFHAIYAVKRKTFGDIFFAVALITSSYFANEPWIFIVSILLLAVADGGAALAGRVWGKSNEYFVFGSKALRKSVAGSITYIILAYVSIAVGLLISGDVSATSNALLLFVILPIGATVLENTTPYGFDNLATPVFAAILLNTIQ